MNKNAIYIRVLLVIVSIAVVLVFINRSPQHTPGDAWLPSSFNPVGAGHMAFYQTLEELGWPVERWREPLSRLSDYGTGNVLIITRSLEGARGNYSDQEIDLLDAWVSKGNTLIMLGALDKWDDTRSLLEKYNFVLNKTDDSAPDFFQSFKRQTGPPLEIQPGADSSLKGTMILPPTRPLGILVSPSKTHLLWQNQGEPYVVGLPRGKGRLIFGSSAQLLSNSWLQRGDNLAIVLHLLEPSGQVPHHVLFEESHHGYSAVYALARLLGHPGVGFAGMLALLGILTFLGSSLIRFGPVIPLHRETGRSTLEFVDSIADLYIRADVRNETMHYLFKETHQRILRRLNLPPTTSHELIASRLLIINPRLPKWKKLAQRFDSTDHVEGLPPTGWLRVARDLIEIKAAMA